LQVSALETIVAKGGKVVDADVVTLTEALMNELVKLDSIAAEGDVKVQRRVQVTACAEYFLCSCHFSAARIHLRSCRIR
jgi:hypothetical protein